jgi:hypothetical protein
MEVDRECFGNTDQILAAGGENFGVFGCVWAAGIGIYGGQMISAHHGRA